MLTPRRTLMLLVGFALFGGAYLVYAKFLGWLDGLPQLPAEMLVRSDGTFRPPEQPVSPTQARLIEAFGPGAPETDYANYPNQFSFPSGQSVVVVACGPVPNNPNSKHVTITPFSLAVFRKPRPPHLREPGEVQEISTIHADKCVLEYDRVVTSLHDMKQAKLMRMELVSDVELAPKDTRRGLVHITNNQRSADPARFLVLRTVGPVFYRDPKPVAGTPAAQGPDLWTDAAVEIVDRQNLPRDIGSGVPVTAHERPEAARTPAAVAAFLSGRRSPPPTVTAVGLRVYLEPEPPPGQPRPPKDPDSAGVASVRRIEFLEQVVMHLWVDDGQSLGPTSGGASKGNALAHTPPPPGLAAVTGGLGPAAYQTRLADRALLQIETRGPFAYDAPTRVARFEVVPSADPGLPNDVRVNKVHANKGTTQLLSQVLELEFNGGLTDATRPKTQAGGAPAIRKLHAWTATPGRYVVMTSQDDMAEAYGQDLVHDQGANRTTLTGAPLYLVRERNVLTAGDRQRPATLVSEPAPIPPTGPGAPPTAPAERKSVVTVHGPGVLEMFDPASGANTIVARWQTSLVQTKDTINGRELDLFTFTDGAKFEDTKADYWLKGNVLKLWLEPGAPQPPGPDGKPVATRPQPARVQAIGDVLSHSTDYDIEEAALLNVYFQEPKLAPGVPQMPQPPAPAAPPVPATPPAMGGAMPPPGPGVPPPAPMPPVPEPIPEPAKPKPPVKIRARSIETWVTRVPVPPGAAQPPAPKEKANGEPGAKYQLDRAVCEDNVTVHQDPTDPAAPRGLDIFARRLLIDGSPDGSVMTVYGWSDKPGEVHQEGMSLVGPKIVLDQVHNAASVEGRGALTMPAGSDLGGSELKEPEVVVIHWRDKMDFKGALRSAQFEGKVSARQGESWVVCHTMHVKFDRPIYFNTAQKKAAQKPGQPEEKAKLDTVSCYPAPADTADDKRELFVTYNQVELDPTGRVIKTQQLTAVELTMKAKVVSEPGAEPHQQVEGEGPGVLRVWQPGDRDAAGPGGGPMQPMAAPGGQKQQNNEEMKLTVITFSRRMVAIDKGKVFQKATFEGDVTAISVPADLPTATVERYKLPPRALLLTCTKELVVSSHKKPNAPTVQTMDARGNAFVRSDDYDGWGETINQDGKVVTLHGSAAIPARIVGRTKNGNDQSGKTIIYDRETGTYRVDGGFGGTIGSPPSNPSPGPMKPVVVPQTGGPMVPRKQ